MILQHDVSFFSLVPRFRLVFLPEVCFELSNMARCIGCLRTYPWLKNQLKTYLLYERSLIMLIDSAKKCYLIIMSVFLCDGITDLALGPKRKTKQSIYCVKL